MSSSGSVKAGWGGRLRWHRGRTAQAYFADLRSIALVARAGSWTPAPPRRCPTATDPEFVRGAAAVPPCRRSALEFDVNVHRAVGGLRHRLRSVQAEHGIELARRA